MKTVKVGTCLILQAAVSLLLPVSYFSSFFVTRGADAVYTHVRIDAWLLAGFALAAVLALYFLRRRGERRDEFARRAVGRADAVCFRVALVFLCAVQLPALLFCTVLRSAPPMTADVIPVGGVLVCGVSALLALRAVIFLRLDRKGMED